MFSSTTLSRASGPIIAEHFLHRRHTDIVRNCYRSDFLENLWLPARKKRNDTEACYALEHARQLMWLLKDKFTIEPDRPLGPELWDGLPIPEQVWDG